MKKNPDVKYREAHKEELLEIMKKSETKKLKVPPGVYCEFGYLMYQDGNTDEALEYIELEEKTYPESIIFTQRLKTMITGQKPQAKSSEPVPTPEVTTTPEEAPTPDATPESTKEGIDEE